MRGAHLEKADRAWRVRVVGGTWQQAAEAAGYSTDEAAIKAVRSAYGTLPKPQRDDLRNLWRERLEVLWQQAVADARDRRHGAVTAAVRVATCAMHLDGLSEPVQVEVGVSLLDRLEQELLGHGL